MSKSVDLTSLTGWANLADGTHNITVVAKASGYADSDPSTAVQVTKGATIEMPSKGDLITMDSKQYRVLKTSGTVAEVLCMYDANASIVFDTNSSYSNTYVNKNIDTYCNSTFYSGLSSAMKSAIVDKTFTQDSWSRATSIPTESHYTGKYGSSNYYLTLSNATYGSSITRHCYCLSVQDVLDYLEATTSMGISDTTLTDTNILQMFWNATTSQSNKYIWLRSARDSNPLYAFFAFGGSGVLDNGDADYALAARPAFQIDLSKVEWSPAGGGTVTGYKLTLTSIYLNAGQTVSIHMNNADGTATVASTLANNMSWENVVSFWITDSYGGSKYIYTNGTMLDSNKQSETNPYVLTQDTTLTFSNSCLTGDMMVTLADGSEKRICDLTLNDTYIAYDLATADLVTAPAKHFDTVNGHSGKFACQYQKYTFEDGTVIKEVNKHRFLNLTRMEFINLCHWKIGDRIYKIDGTTPALVSKEVVTETVEHFTVTTAKYHNGFVQGCLYGDRYTQRYEIQMIDGKPKYDFSKPHTIDYLYGKLNYDD